MKKIIPLLILLSASLVWFGFGRQAAPPDLSTPQSAVRAFVAALIVKDADTVAACVQGATAGPDLKSVFASDLGPTARVTSAEVKSVLGEVNGDQAKVAVEVTLLAPPAQDREGAKVSLSVVELFTMRREKDLWRIVPDEAVLKQIADPSLVGTRYELRPLATMAALIASPALVLKDMNHARETAMTAACVSNLKQIAIGTIMYVQDYDEIFPRKKASYKDLIFPYVKNNEIFRCPADAKGIISYAFNPNMQGAQLAAVESPAQTVLLYEGKNMQPAFKHQGRAAVAFADGHVKLMTPEQIKEVFWYPAGKNPTSAKTAKPARPQAKAGKGKR